MNQSTSLSTSKSASGTPPDSRLTPSHKVRQRAHAQLGDVLSYCHPGVVERIAGALGVDAREAELLFLETKRFIWLCSFSEHVLVPSPTIDEGWHAFVLHTRDYAAFCEQYLDRFVHHQPHTKADRKARADGGAAYRRTLALAREVFGSVLSDHWAGRAESTTQCSGSTNCQAPYR